MRSVVTPIAIGLGAVLVLTLAQLVRTHGSPVYRTLWAEDGSAFLRGGVAHVSIFSTYAGYLNVVPRVVGWLAASLPLSWAAAWFAVVTALLTSLLALAVFHLSDFVVRSTWLRVVLALAFILPPILVYETMASAANLQWPLLGALFWALARPATRRWDTSVCAVIVLAAALSSSVALLFLPLAALVVVLRRADRRAWIVPGLFAVACVVQLVAVVTTSAPAARSTATVGGLPRLYVVNVVGETVLGHRLVDEVWLGPGFLPFVALGIALGVALAFLFVRADGLGRLWGGAAIVMSVGVYSAAVFWRGSTQASLVEGVMTGSGARYTALGLQLLVGAAVVLVDRAALAERTHRVLVALLVAQAVLIPLTAYRVTTIRSRGPEWASALADARHVCERSDAPFSVQAIPTTPNGWLVLLPCHAIA